MAQDITSIIDGIRRSVETVGRSGREEVSLDNVSFRIDVATFEAPHGTSLAKARQHAPKLFSPEPLEAYNHELGQLFICEAELPYCVVAMQMLPTDHRGLQRFTDMTVTVSTSDVVNDLAQDALTCVTALRLMCEEVGTSPGRVTFNIAYAYVLWEDVELLVDPEEIEIPR